MIKKIRERIQSDEAAMGTVETLLLIVMAIFALLALYNFVIVPFSKSAEGMGKVISEANPE